MKNYFWKMFSNIKNGQLAKRPFVYQKRKKICEGFLKVLWDEGFILGYKVSSVNSGILKIFLKYQNGIPVISSMQLITRPSKRVYYSLKQIWKFDSGKACVILSTNKGLKTVTECKKLKIGGEPFLIVN